MRQTASNITSSYCYGISLWATMNLIKGKLNYNGGLDIQHKKLDFNNLSNKGCEFSYTMNLTYRLSPTIYMNCYGTWQNRRIFLQGFENSYLYSNISIQKGWHNNQFRLAASIDNPFVNGVRVRRSYDIGGTNYYSNVRYHNTGIRIFFIYKFGKHDMEKSMKVDNNMLNKYWIYHGGYEYSTQHIKTVFQRQNVSIRERV